MATFALATDRVASAIIAADTSVATTSPAQHLKFRPSTFDVVISRNTLMFIPDLTRALAEMNRVMKWKGRIAATVWASARRNPRLSGPLEAARAMGVKGPPTATFRIALRLGAPSLLAMALRGSGFSDVVVERWPVVPRYDTVNAAVQQAMDHTGTRELMELLSRDSERRMSRSLAQRWQKYAGQGGVNLPGKQLVAAGAKSA